MGVPIYRTPCYEQGSCVCLATLKCLPHSPHRTLIISKALFSREDLYIVYQAHINAPYILPLPTYGSDKGSGWLLIKLPTYGAIAC